MYIDYVTCRKCYKHKNEKYLKYKGRSINKIQTVALVAWYEYDMSPFKNWDKLREILRSIKLLAGFGDSSQENIEAVVSLGRGKEG